ncbi:MAG: hypothetical protein OEY25_13365 [Candidatus Aminicenantes bacterium]|nr:hypothetical protein [Candidatus Aminicenantes bacterium]MDH5706583.1 hypothetical protein [Candidatus Aminicenantes bacterium]
MSSLIPKILLVVTFALLVVTAGCGLTIRFGGEEFRKAISGHMVLGILTLIFGLATMISLLAVK